MRLLFTLLIIIGFTSFNLLAQEIEYEIKENIHYYSDSLSQSDQYINDRCVLDIYFPKNIKNFATIIWFHGGGLTSNSKEIPESLMDQGFCIIGVNYRLSPKVKAPKYIEDAAASVSWAFNNIESFGGDSSLIFVAGHSAGGYLASMVGLDKSFLHSHNIDANRIAGLIPFSGHTITHFTIRKENGIEGTQPTIDKYAPLFHVRSDASPLLLITGDRELEMLGRYEENAYLMRMMKIVGHMKTKLYELDGFDHGSMMQPAMTLLLNEVRKITQERKIMEVKNNNRMN